MDREAAKDFKEGAGPGMLWAGVLAAPTAMLAQLQANYSLVHWACANSRTWPLHLVALLALLVAVGGGLLSWRNWHRAGASWEVEGAGVAPRSRFMAIVGMLLSAHISLVILTQWAAIFFYGPCQR